MRTCDLKPEVVSSCGKSKFATSSCIVLNTYLLVQCYMGDCIRICDQLEVLPFTISLITF